MGPGPNIHILRRPATPCTRTVGPWLATASCSVLRRDSPRHRPRSVRGAIFRYGPRLLDRFWRPLVDAITLDAAGDCLAYCLMPNHYHLLVETPETDLSEGMHHLNSTYATRFNCDARTRGHVFQGDSTPSWLRSDEHLSKRSATSSSTPCAAPSAVRPDDWRWSSYRATVGVVARRQAWLQSERVLGAFRAPTLRPPGASTREFVACRSRRRLDRTSAPLDDSITSARLDRSSMRHATNTATHRS